MATKDDSVPSQAGVGTTQTGPDVAGLLQMLDAVCITDPSWQITFWNPGARRLLGAPTQPDLWAVLPAAFAPLRAGVEQHLLESGAWRGSVRITTDDGSAAHLACQVVLQRHPDGRPYRILMSFNTQPDWTGRERREALRHAADAGFDSLFGQHPDGVFTLDRNGCVITANQAACALSGYAQEAVTGRRFEMLVNVAQRHALQAAFEEALSGRPSSSEYLLVAASAATCEVGLTLLPNMVDHCVVGVHGIVKDLSTQKEDQRRILYLANHDALTGLPNRRLLQHRMQHSLENARRAGAKVGVLFMDLNRFKVVNDSLGHDKGDLLLCAVADRLKHAIRDVDTVSRIGGDEFVVVLECIENTDAILHVAQNLLRAINQPILLQGETVIMGTSIGASVYPDDGGDTTTLLKNADLAMYAAKETGTSFFQMYDPAMNARALARLSTENSLRDAIAHGQLVLHYQPRLDLVTNRIAGVEALVRWDHPERGLIYPSGFIALAEETGMIDALGEWVLASACRQMAAWRTLGMEPIRISVNMSALQLKSPGVCAMVSRVIAEAHFDPHCLELEITESSLMDNVAASLDTLTRLKALGITLAIDDFGTGYSSLAYLKRLPIGTLKIDKSFIRGLSDDKDDAAIVSATVAMAHSMDLKVVAEGVTSFAQVRLLESYGCDEIQGYLVCQPLPAPETESYLRTCELRGIQYSWVN